MKKTVILFLTALSVTISPVISCERGSNLEKISYIIKYVIRKIDEGIYPVTTLEVSNALKMYNDELSAACQKCRTTANITYFMLINRLENFIERGKSKPAQDATTEKDTLVCQIIDTIKQKILITANTAIHAEKDLADLNVEALTTMLHDLGQDVVMIVKPTVQNQEKGSTSVIHQK